MIQRVAGAPHGPHARRRPRGRRAHRRSPADVLALSRVRGRVARPGGGGLRGPRDTGALPRHDRRTCDPRAVLAARPRGARAVVPRRRRPRGALPRSDRVRHRSGPVRGGIGDRELAARADRARGARRRADRPRGARRRAVVAARDPRQRVPFRGGCPLSGDAPSACHHDESPACRYALSPAPSRRIARLPLRPLARLPPRPLARPPSTSSPPPAPLPTGASPRPRAGPHRAGFRRIGALSLSADACYPDTWPFQGRALPMPRAERRAALLPRVRGRRRRRRSRREARSRSSRSPTSGASPRARPPRGPRGSCPGLPPARWRDGAPRALGLRRRRARSSWLTPDDAPLRRAAVLRDALTHLRAGSRGPPGRLRSGGPDRPRARRAGGARARARRRLPVRCPRPRAPRAGGRPRARAAHRRAPRLGRRSSSAGPRIPSPLPSRRRSTAVRALKHLVTLPGANHFGYIDVARPRRAARRPRRGSRGASSRRSRWATSPRSSTATSGTRAATSTRCRAKASLEGLEARRSRSAPRCLTEDLDPRADRAACRRHSSRWQIAARSTPCTRRTSACSARRIPPEEARRQRSRQGRGRTRDRRDATFRRVYQLGGLVVTLVNGLLGLILWRRLRAAFPRHGAMISGLCAAGLLLAALPALLMRRGELLGLRALQRHAPEPLALIAMGAQVGLLLYPGCSSGSSRSRARPSAPHRLQPRRNARACGRCPACDEHAGQRRRRSQSGRSGHPRASGYRGPTGGRRRAPPPLVVGATWALPAAAVAVSMGGVLASRQRPVVVRLALPVRRDLTSLHGVTIAQLSDVHVGSFMDAGAASTSSATP